MTLAWLRQTRLSVGRPGETGFAFPGSLRTSFDISRDLDPEPNTATFEITNLAEDSRSRFDADGAIVVFEAGYQDTGLFQLFVGEVARVEHRRDERGTVTRLECDDGADRYRARLVVNEPPGVTIGQVVTSIARALGIPARLLGLVAQPLSRGYSHWGSAHDALTDLCERAGLNWSIQSRVLQVLPEGSVLAEAAPLLTPDSGLIGWPVKTKIDIGGRRSTRRRPRGQTLRQRDAAKASGVKFEAYLLHNMYPGQRVRIESRDVLGVYKIHRLRYSGDSVDGDFGVSVEALE